MGVWLVSCSSCLLISKLDITSPEPSAAVSSKNPTGFSQNALRAVPCKVAGVAFWRGILISQNQRDPSPSSIPAWSPWLGVGQLSSALVMPSHPHHSRLMSSGRGDPKAQPFSKEKQICFRACCHITVAKGHWDRCSLTPLGPAPSQKFDL